MRVRRVYVRYYRAFNYDYLRKHHPSAKPDPWDEHDGMFYPYVKVDLDEAITCVVGANESGKSQLLDAIEIALGAKSASPADFCRYSRFFTVGDTLRVPHFGVTVEDLTESEVETLGSAIDRTFEERPDRVHLFRENRDEIRVFVADEDEPHVVGSNALADVPLPATFRIDTSRPIPDSVPIDYLVKRADGPVSNVVGRLARWRLVDPIVKQLNPVREAIGKNDTQALTKLLSSAAADAPDGQPNTDEFDLAYQLLVTVGGVSPTVFPELETALRAENEGFANGLVASINRKLSESLNLSRWWSQDDQFDLQIAARDFDLVFTIKDRTASEYSFAERSSGLKYFLSYLVQYLARRAQGETDGLLLMDEPDAYLSSQGQQDLLKLLKDFAEDPAPLDAEGARQVVFVTHSPFLIDKNRADRIRVLDKGDEDEGTRVVRDVGRNHYEPLRSALGSYVGETAFIGNCNIVVEGIADQVYLAGVSSALARYDAAPIERLDLNQVTLVPAGSASQIPYVTFLIRGRDADQPAVVVLLDGDKAGDDAARDLDSGPPRGKQLLDPKFVLRIDATSLEAISSDRPNGPREIEDLVPIAIAVRAVTSLADELGLGDEKRPDAKAVKSQLADDVGVFKASQLALEKVGSSIRLDKIAFARHVVKVLDAAGDSAAKAGRNNFRHLFLKLGELQREAVAERSRREVGARVDRTITAFLNDHVSFALRSDLRVLLERIEGLLDSTVESEEIRKSVRLMRSELNLDADLAKQVEDIQAVRAQLEAMKYAGVIASQDQQ